jgi:hypothetical protein
MLLSLSNPTIPVNRRRIGQFIALFPPHVTPRIRFEVQTSATSLREFFLSGQLPKSIEHIPDDEVVYLLLDDDGALLEAAGTSEWFWNSSGWISALSRMTSEMVIAESGEFVMFLTKLKLRSACHEFDKIVILKS